MGFSQNLFLDQESSGGSDSMPCVQKLLPCQPYLKSSKSAPPASCCAPLKEIITDDKKCLCAVFNNPAIMKTLNVTQDDALNLAKTCGSKADASFCRTASTTPSPTTPSSPGSSNSSENSSGAPKSSDATVISHFGRSVGVAASVFLVSLHPRTSRFRPSSFTKPAAALPESLPPAGDVCLFASCDGVTVTLG